MNTYSRRSFLRGSVAGAVAAGSLFLSGRRTSSAMTGSLDRVILGKTGIEVSEIAMGTGTNGGRHHSNQTKLGMKDFVALANFAYDHGITFLEAADIYGSHVYIREALKQIPRDKVVILTKMWTRPNEWMKIMTASEFLRMFMRELGTDYIDIVLLHCMVAPDWPSEMESFCAELEQAKQKGDIRAHGVSCHSLDALKTAARSDWVDILQSRINHAGAHMDDTPENVVPVLKQARERGAGVIGMKIYGQGDLAAEEERQKSLEFVINSGTAHAMTIGFESPGQVDDTINRVNGIQKG